ncbi:mitochondrial folate carrier protein Flx1 [Spinellus fusiger]|nr:mitochondrial folate carrier protein Flx1 [Spinellus fusiger]
MTKSFTISPHMDQAMAGFSAGMVSTLILHPLDLIKIRFQVQVNTTQKPGIPLLGGTFKTFRSILVHEGLVHGLYRGVTPNMAGATASWGLYFWWYSQIKQALRTEERDTLAAWQHLCASAAAGAVTAVMTNPLWVVKTRMCTTTHTSPEAYRGLWDGLQRLAREEGWRGLYRGLVPGLLGVSHGALQFMAYEEMKKCKGKETKLSNTEYLLMAGSSKVVATVATYPYQVLRSRLQNRETRDAYKSVVDCVKKIHALEGYNGFYKGLAPNVLRVLPGTCITFLVYENMSQWFKDHAT